MTSPRPSHPASPAILPAELVPERAGTVGLLGNQSRQGDWILPREFRAVALVGNVRIDLTHARVGEGRSRIEVRSIFGDVEIIVPPHLRVDCDGTSILGNFEADTGAQRALPDAPLISVGGTAFMGNVKVKVVDPNAPGWLDKLAARFSK